MQKITVKKQATDTLDYSSLFNAYTLKGITEKNRVTELQCYNGIYYCYDSINFRRSGFWKKDTLTLKRSDTLINMDWYLVANQGCLCGNYHCDLWKLKLNLTSNVMIMEKALDFGTHELATKITTVKKMLFKVLKFSASEIIIRELATKPRTYYFRRYKAKTDRTDP